MAYTSDGGIKGSSYSGDGAFKIIMMEQSGSSTTWQSVQEIKPKGYVYTGEWSTQVRGYVKHIVMNNFTDASPGNYFMGVRVQDYTLESVYVYKNEKFGQEDSEWVLHQEEPVWTKQLTSSTNYNQSPTMLFSEMGLIILSRKGSAVTDGISSKCAALDVYDVLTNTISRVGLPECMHERLAVHANSNYLVVGHLARVYVFKKSSDGTFYQEDELKLTYNENVSAGLWSGVTGGHVNFGYRVYVSPTNDIYTFQPHETTFNDYDGALHRFQRTRKTSSDSVTINGKQLYQDSDGWILLLAYEHKAGENNALVSKTAPSSPTEGYSHIWLEDLGLAASDVDSVKFYCKTSAHSRVMHFSSSTDFVKNAIVTGAYTGNVVSYWNSGTTKFDDHTANLPDSTDEIWVASDLMNFPFYGGGNHWAIKTAYWSRSGFFCDDGGPTHADMDTLHQIWFKRTLNPYESNIIFNFEASKEHVEGGKWSNAISSESYGDGSISEGIARSTISTSLESDPPSIVFSGGATGADWKDAVILSELDLKRDWSFEIKVKMHDVMRNQGFFGQGTHGTRTGIFLTVMKAPWNRGIVFSFGNSDLDDKTTPLVANEWYHIIFTYAHSNGYLKAIYVNGELTVSSGGSSSDLPYLGTGQPLIGRTIGLEATSSARYGLDGEIAFARMYDKTLSASEVKTLHDLS